MRKLYNEFFYIPKHGKISEKVMLTRVATTIVIMVVCLALMSLTAYAYFSYNVTSVSNTIKAANFEANVAISITDDNGVAVNINPITSNNKSFVTEELEVGKFYTVTITHTERSTAKTGFVVVTADGCDKTYHTQQLAKDVNAEGGATSEITFRLMITAKTRVKFLAHWGTSIYYDTYENKGINEELYIIQNEDIKLTINEPDNTDEQKEDTTPTAEEVTSSSAETTKTDETVTPEEQTQSVPANTESTDAPTTEETDNTEDTVK